MSLPPQATNLPILHGPINDGALILEHRPIWVDSEIFDPRATKTLFKLQTKGLTSFLARQ